MTKLYISTDPLTLVKYAGKGPDWIGVVDEDAPSTTPSIFTVSTLEKSLFSDKESGEGLRKRMVDWIKIWPDRPVLEGKSVKQLLKYDKTSLWWFGESLIFRYRFGGYPSFQDIFTRIEALKSLIVQKGITEVHLCGPGSLTLDCAHCICTSLKIKVKCHNYRKPSGIPDSLRPLLIHRFKRIRGQLRATIARMNSQRYARRSISGRSVLTLSYYMSLREDVFIKKEEEGSPTNLPKDMMLYPVLRQLQVKGAEPRIMYVDRRYPFGLDSIMALNSPTFPSDLYIKIIDKKLYKRCKKIRALWKQLRKSTGFRDSLDYQGVNVWPLVKDVLSFMFIKQMPEAIEYIHIMEAALRKERPKAVLISDETGFYGRSLVVAGKRAKIRTIGLQHGNLAYLEVEHYHQNESADLPCPIPDITALGGSQDMELMLRGELYSERNLAITGRPRYDNIAKMHEYYDREEVKRRFNIQTDRIVLLTTVRYPDIQDRITWLKALLKVSRNIPSAFFLVKPHPGEDDAVYTQLIDEIAGENVKLVDKYSDTKELLYACDVAVNAGSTVGLEAILMGKPFLMVNLTGREDITPYAEMGAAIPVRDEGRLEPALREILDAGVPSSLKEGMNRFIEGYAHKVDGRSSERVANLILQVQ